MIDAIYIERFTGKFIPEPNSGCWLWENATDHGYGVFSLEGKSWRAHRAAWMLFNGPIPNGLFVLHRCDTRCCVNPRHLYLGTHADNMRDMTTRNRQACGTRQGLSKLTDDDVGVIRSSGEPKKALAREYGVAPVTIRDLLARRTWRHVAPPREQPTRHQCEATTSAGRRCRNSAHVVEDLCETHQRWGATR